MPSVDLVKFSTALNDPTNPTGDPTLAFTIDTSLLATVPNTATLLVYLFVGYSFQYSN